ncbi:MAG: carbon monoxide dehydrogenase, partial [Candidatus Bipolaricaulaceae bacterium]
MERSVDKAAQEMLRVAKERNLNTAWDRRDQQGVPCRFGLVGLCCRICQMGPCRIVEGRAPRGVCGADADTIAARNLLRMIAAGVAAHSDHGRDVAHTLLRASEDGDYQVKDPVKLRRLAHFLGIEAPAKDERTLA